MLNPVIKSSAILALILVVFAAPATASLDLTVNYQNVQEATSIAFDCENSDCSRSSDFSGSYPDGTSTQDGSLLIRYPSESTAYGYAEFHVSDGYLPKEYRVKNIESGVDSVNVSFNKAKQCSAPIGSVSIDNKIYRDEPVVVKVPSVTSGELGSAFSDADTGVNFVPEQFQDQYYSSRINVSLIVKNATTGETIQSFEQRKNIYMDNQRTFEFEWTPTNSGNHTAVVKSEVVDNQCASSNDVNTSKQIDVLPERPYNEYYTKIDNLDVERSSKYVGNSHTFSFSKISNYADDSQPPQKTPVETSAEYTVKRSGQTVWTDLASLPANSDTGRSYYNFNWAPQQPGNYTVNVRGESIIPGGLPDAPKRPQSQTLKFEVEPVPTWTVNFEVESDGSKLKNANISFGEAWKTTDVNGEASFTVEKGVYNYSISKTGYSSLNGTLDIDPDTADPFLIMESLENTNTPPEVNLPGETQYLTSGEVDTDIDLDDHVNDNSRDEDISWSISKSGLSNLSVSIEEGNVLRMAAQEGFTGSGTVTLTATDPAGATGTDTMTVEVTESNTAPVVDIPDVTIQEDSGPYPSQFNLQERISDAETSYSNLEVSLNIQNPGCGIEMTQSDNIQIAPQRDFDESCSATVIATDPQGLTGTDSFDVTVTPVNDAPVISSQPTTEETVKLNGQHSYTVQVSDPDDGLSQLDFSIAEGPENISISSNGVVEWTPGPGVEGNYTVKLKVEDSGGLYDTQEYTLEVNGSDGEAPNEVISANVTEGSAPLTVKFNGSGSSDPDGSIVEYFWRSGEGRTDTGTTAVYTYTQPGTYIAELSVKDDQGLEHTTSVKINVTGNSAPYFISSPVTTATVGQEYTYDATAEDEDGDTLEYSLAEKPSGMQIDNVTGKVAWTPSSSGSFDVQINVSDGMESASQSYSIDVEGDSSSGGGGDNGGDNGGNSDDDDDSSSGGGGGGGGSSYSGGGASYDTYFTSVSGEKSLSDVFSFRTGRLNLELRPDTAGEVKVNYSLNRTEVNVSEFDVSLDDNITEIMDAPEELDNRSYIPVNISTGEPGFYRGSLNVEWKNQTESLPLKATVQEERVQTETGSVGFLIITEGFQQDSSYRIRLDGDTGETQTVTLTTRVKDSSGKAVFEQTREVDVENVEVEHFKLDRNLEPGTYTIEAKVNYGGNTGLKTAQVTVGQQNSITGAFTNSASGIIQRIIDFFASLF